MTVALNIENDAELRAYIKDLIKGQVLSIIRQEVLDVIKAITEDKIKSSTTQTVLEKLIKEIIEKQVREQLNISPWSNADNFIKTNAKEMIYNHIKSSFKV